MNRTMKVRSRPEKMLLQGSFNHFFLALQTMQFNYLLLRSLIISHNTVHQVFGWVSRFELEKAFTSTKLFSSPLIDCKDIRSRRILSII